MGADFAIGTLYAVNGDWHPANVNRASSGVQVAYTAYGFAVLIAKLAVVLLHLSGNRVGH